MPRRRRLTHDRGARPNAHHRSVVKLLPQQHAPAFVVHLELPGNRASQQTARGQRWPRARPSRTAADLVAIANAMLLA
eukprot:353404-Chlamydomonas_euryale.AAC.7